MVKSLVAVCVSACLLLSLSACTQDKDANTMLAGDTTEPARTLRIAAAANLSDVLPHIIDSYQADNSSSAQNVSSISDIEVTYASTCSYIAIDTTLVSPEMLPPIISTTPNSPMV